MKKILALAVLAGALSSCVISVEGNPVVPPTITTASVIIRNANGVSQTDANGAFACQGKANTLDLSFNWTGALNEYAVKSVGATNPNSSYRDPSNGSFYQATGLNFTANSGIYKTLFTDQNVFPFKGAVSTQAVVVTTKFSLEIEYRSTGGVTKNFAVPGSVTVYPSSAAVCM